MKLRWNWNRWPWAVAAFLLAGGNTLAHEKWFVDEHSVPRGLPVFLRVDPVFAIVSAFVLAMLFLCAVWIDRRYDGSKLARWLDERLIQAHLNPRAILGALIGVSLMGAGLQGALFSPNLVLPGNEWGTALLVLEIALGTLFLFLEPAFAELGLLLAVLYVAGLTVMPFWTMVEELLLFGAAVFFVTNEKFHLPWSAWNTPERRRLGYQAMRILIGVNFLVLSGVKWLRPELGLGVVRTYHINFLAGLSVSDMQFIYLAAIFETVVALCILLRVAFRPAIFAALMLFIVSVYFLGSRELLGHLPVKGVLFLMLLYGHWHKGEQKNEGMRLGNQQGAAQKPMLRPEKRQGA